MKLAAVSVAAALVVSGCASTTVQQSPALQSVCHVAGSTYLAFYADHTVEQLDNVNPLSVLPSWTDCGIASQCADFPENVPSNLCVMVGKLGN